MHINWHILLDKMLEKCQMIVYAILCFSFKGLMYNLYDQGGLFSLLLYVYN